MVCRLCLKFFEDLINIFDATDHKLSMAEVIGKYFWFKPQKDDPISVAICSHCLGKVYDFHEFYVMVEKAQQQYQMTDELSIKTEDTNNIPNKLEPEDEFVELDEMPFNATDVLEIGTTKRSNRNVSRDVLSHTDLSHDEYENDDEDDEDYVCQDSEINDDSQDEKDNEQILEEEEEAKEKLIKIEQTTSNDKKPTRKTRNSNKSKVKQKNKKDKEDRNSIKKKRGRPITREGNTRKPAKTKEEQDAYKAKMVDYDQQIAQYMSLHCDVCTAEAKNFPALRVHMRDVHDIKEGYVICCEKKFNKRALLVYHIRHHLNPRCYRCEECDFTFGDRQSMHNHFLVKHQKEEDKSFGCPNCPKKFSRKYLLEQHCTFSHRGPISKCKNCNKRFKHPEELVEHNKKECISGTMCDICAKVIKGTAAFERHQLEHQGVAIPKEQCDVCGLWYKDKRGLKRHKRRHVESKEPHTCDICHKVSPSRNAMMSHKRYVHVSERLFECNICQKTFKKPISLREHMTTHTGEVLYSCPHCTKTFNSNANMHSHRKKVHPREFEETRKLRKLTKFVNDQTAVPNDQTLSEELNNFKEETQISQNLECLSNY